MRKRQPAQRDFVIHAGPPKPGGEGYVRIATGRNSENDRGAGSLYVGKASFAVAAGIVKRHYTKYDHYEEKNISRTTGTKIVAALRESAEKLAACKGREILETLAWFGDKDPKTVDDFVKRKGTIAKMLTGLADYMETAYETDEWICISDFPE